MTIARSWRMFLRGCTLNTKSGLPPGSQMSWALCLIFPLIELTEDEGGALWMEVLVQACAIGKGSAIFWTGKWQKWLKAKNAWMYGTAHELVNLLLD